MDYLEKDIQILGTLLNFLQESFKGASIGSLRMEEATEALERVLKTMVEVVNKEE